MKLLKFSAEWCGPCQLMKQRLQSFDACPVIEYDVDDDANNEIVSKYQIRNIPVLILLDENENILHKWVGAINVSEINNEIKKYNN